MYIEVSLYRSYYEKNEAYTGVDYYDVAGGGHEQLAVTFRALAAIDGRYGGTGGVRTQEDSSRDITIDTLHTRTTNIKYGAYEFRGGSDITIDEVDRQIVFPANGYAPTRVYFGPMDFDESYSTDYVLRDAKLSIYDMNARLDGPIPLYSYERPYIRYPFIIDYVGNVYAPHLPRKLDTDGTPVIDSSKEPIIYYTPYGDALLTHLGVYGANQTLLIPTTLI